MCPASYGRSRAFAPGNLSARPRCSELSTFPGLRVDPTNFSFSRLTMAILPGLGHKGKWLYCRVIYRTITQHACAYQ